jgi:hypothetical protein
VSRRLHDRKQKPPPDYGLYSNTLLRITGGQWPFGVSLDGRVHFIAPPIFSLIENPQGVLFAIRRLALEVMMPNVREILIDLSKVSDFDIGANALLSMVIEEVAAQAEKAVPKHKIEWLGRYPKDASIRRLVQAIGFIQRLKVRGEFPPLDVASRLEVFTAQRKADHVALHLDRRDQKSLTTKKFADHINRCLSHRRLMLTPEALQRLCAYVGEMLDNAEEHSGGDYWTIEGYLDTHTDDWMCEIVIFNLGNSISQSLAKLPPTHYTATQIDPYLRTHVGEGMSGFSLPTLRTVIALQGGVSSKNHSKADTRGMGTVELIEFFQGMYQEAKASDAEQCALMSLISGSTRIVFDGKYAMDKNAGSPVIAFNASNRLQLPPDKDYVSELDESVRFPGTILSIRFPLADNSTVALTNRGAE